MSKKNSNSQIIVKSEEKKDENNNKTFLKLNENVFNIKNVNIQRLMKNELSISDKVEICQNFVIAHITDVCFSVKIFNKIAAIFKVLSNENETEKLKELCTQFKIKSDNFELSELQKRRNEYLQKTYKQTITYNKETNLFVINTKNFATEFVQSLHNYVINCVTYNDAKLFNDYVLKTAKSETAKSESKKFNDLFTFDKHSYNIVRNFELFDLLKKYFLETCQNENEKKQILRNSLIDFNESMLKEQCHYNNTEKRKNIKQAFKTHLQTLNDDYINENSNVATLEHVETLCNKVLQLQNVVSLMKFLNNANK